jgi:chorismate mutase
MVRLRGIRGAIGVRENTKECVRSSAKELLVKMLEANDVETEEIASILFTATDDLDAEFPALAARDLGNKWVPLLCAREINVENGSRGVIRVLIHVNTEKSQKDIRHQYLQGAEHLRPDLSQGGDHDDRSNED